MAEFFESSTYWKKQAHEPFTMYSAGHITVIVLMFLAIALLIVFGRKIKHSHIKIYLTVSAIFWAVMESFKIILFFTTSGDSYQALREVLPLYMCSLFVYMLPLAAFARGTVKKIGEYTLTTLCLLSGILTTVNCPALYSYPFWSFYSLHSVLYHALMAVTGVLLLTGGYVRLELKRFYLPLITIGILAVPAIIMNYTVNTDYMLMRYAWGTPVLEPIAKALGGIPQIFLMLFTYTLIAFLMTLMGVGVKRLIRKKA